MEKSKQLFKLFVRRLQCTVAALIRKMLIPLQPLFRSGILFLCPDWQALHLNWKSISDALFSFSFFFCRWSHKRKWS